MDEVAAKSMDFKMKMVTATEESLFLLEEVMESNLVPVEWYDGEVQQNSNGHHDEVCCGLEMPNPAPIAMSHTIIESPPLLT